MNTKNNRRKRDSIVRIEKTFIELLQTRELNEITVSDICKLSGLNRSTFYANYVDIFDLADKIREHLEKEVSNLYAEDISHNFNSNNFLKLFQHIKANQLFYLTYFKLGYDNQHQIYLYDTELSFQHFSDRHIHYHIEFFKNGLNAIVKMWLAGGCRESPEEMSEIIKSEYQGRM